MKTPISRRTQMAAALLAGALTLAGCADSSKDNDGDKGPAGSPNAAEIYKTGLVNVDAADAGDPVDGGTLTVADFGEPRSLDTTKTYANGATGGSALAAIYDTLMRYDYETSTFVPQLAESLESNDDNTEWTLKLRDGVKFTDGTPLNADAFLANYAYYTASYGYQFQLLLGNVAKTEKVDDLTVKFTMNGPWARFPNMLAQGPGMVMAPAAYKDPENFKPIGAGPFKFKNYAPTEELVLDANKDYFNGAPHLDALRFVWLGAVDDTPKLEALKSGAADTAFLRDSRVIEKAVEDDKAGGMMFSTGLGAALWINMREGRPGTDPRVREALNYAFDPVAYNERTADGTGQPTKLLFPSTSAWTTDVTPPAADPEKAKELLKEAMADGYDGKISYTYGADADSQTEATTLKAFFEAVGFKVTLVPLRSVADQVQKLYIDHDFDLAVGAGSMLDVDPYAALSSILFSQSGSNSSGYVSEEMDGLLAELRTVPGPAEGKDVMTKIQELWDKDVPGIGINGGGSFLPWNDNVHGISPTTETMVLYDKAWKK